MVYEPPNLATTRPKSKYKLRYGDIIFCSTIFTTSFAFVIDVVGSEIEVAVSGSLAELLVGNDKFIRRMKYDYDTVMSSNKYVILQNNNGMNLWYV